MIDEKRLIEDILQHENVLASANHIYKSGYRDRQDEIIDIINSQPKVGEWIPVSKELPEDDELVLATVNDKHNNVTFENTLMTGCYCYAEGWILEGYIDWVGPNVTAWMPLPEPYKEQNDAI